MTPIFRAGEDRESYEGMEAMKMNDRIYWIGTALIVLLAAAVYGSALFARYRMCSTHFPDEVWTCFASGDYRVRTVQ